MIRTVDSNRSRREEENGDDLGIACDRSQRNVTSPILPVANTTGVAIVYLFQQTNKTCNNSIISSTKLCNQKGKCPSCWPPI